VGPALSIQMGDPAVDGDETVGLQARTMRSWPGWQVSATRTCGDGPASAIRMWPADAAGAFRGRVPAGSRADCRVDARVEGLGQASAELEPAAAGRRSPRWTQQEMAAIASKSDGTLITDGDVGPLVRGWLEAHSAERRPEPRYPMRSWWWLLPFVATVAGEWWLRRRTGLR
jgi:hypothetical protein